LAHLQAEAKKLGISVGEFIRRIIDQHRSAPASPITLHTPSA
jgi:hypothetical protein